MLVARPDNMLISKEVWAVKIGLVREALELEPQWQQEVQFGCSASAVARLYSFGTETLLRLRYLASSAAAAAADAAGSASAASSGARASSQTTPGTRQQLLPRAVDVVKASRAAWVAQHPDFPAWVAGQPEMQPGAGEAAGHRGQYSGRWQRQAVQ